MLKHLRGALPLVTSLALVLVLGTVAAWGQLATAGRVEGAQRADRLRMEQTLSGLTDQYLQFAFLDTLRAADGATWNLRPQDAADTATLERAVHGSPLAAYGAALATITGQVLTAYAPAGLPAADDPGFEPLRRSLLKGQPGLSDVMAAGSSSVVAFAVPVRRNGAVVALLLAFADVRSWPLQTYDSTMHLGRSADTYVLDAKGTVAASNVLGSVGNPLTDLPAAVTAGGSGVIDVTQDGVDQVVSYSPVGHGWTTVQVQDQEAFSGGIQSRSRRDAVLVVLLLTLVALLLGAFSYSRQNALRRLADERLKDPLTGLAQRRLFHLRVDSALARFRRSGVPLAVLYCDLDKFKDVNDTYGHNAGDQLLVAVAERMRSATREDDLVARLGGDEFAVVLEGTDPATVADVVSRLRQRVERPLLLGSAVVHPRISVGAAVLRDASRADDLLAEADLAMYQVKRGAGGSGLVVLDALGDRGDASSPAFAADAH
jgi:diguanylate cyclase (GGDEF)-like protein